jgi:hypothetical protein
LEGRAEAVRASVSLVDTSDNKVTKRERSRIDRQRKKASGLSPVGHQALDSASGVAQEARLSDVGL